MRGWILLAVVVVASCTKETTPPSPKVIPSITWPASGSVVRQVKLTVRGQAQAGDSVDVFVDGWLRARVPADEAGSFQAAGVPLGGQGGRVIWARLASDTTATSAPVVVSVSWEGLEAPVIFFPPHGSSVPASAVPLMGRAPRDVGEVEVYRDGTLVARVPASQEGFSVSALDPSGVGTIRLWTRGLRPSGTTTAWGETIAVQVGHGFSPVVERLSNPPGDTIVADQQVVVAGTALGPAHLLLCVDGGWAFGESHTSGNAFSFQPLALLGEGVHVVGVLSARGSLVVAEEALRLWVDRTPPVAPVILVPAAGEVLRDPLVVVRGATEPGARVQVEADGLSSQEVSADQSGAFSVVVSLPGPGSYTLRARSRDRAGNSSAWTSLLLTVDTSAPWPPLLSSPQAGLVTVDTVVVRGEAQEGCWLEVLVDGLVAWGGRASNPFSLVLPTPRPDGPHVLALRASSAPGGGWVRGDSVALWVDLTPPGPAVVLSPPESTTLSAWTVRFQGAAEPRARVSLWEGSQRLGQTDAGADGTWAMTLQAPAADGWWEVSTSVVDSAGHQGPAGRPHGVYLDRTPPPLQVARPDEGQLFTGNPVPVEGTTEPGALVFVQGRPVETWSGAFQTVVAVAEGSDTIVVKARDAVGNERVVRRAVTLDTTSPFIVLSSPQESLLTQASSVQVRGQTEVGSSVTVQGAPVAVDATGSFAAWVPLGLGWTTITVTSVDRAGWTTSLQRHVVRDDLPTQPSSLSPDQGRFCATGRPTLRMVPAVDPNGDVLWHVVEVYADASLTQRLAQSPALPSSGGLLSWVVTPELGLTGGLRYWRARAYDGILWGPWSAVATFSLPDVGGRDPHRVLGYGDSITGGAQTQNGGWIFSEGYRPELQLALEAFWGEALVETDYVPGGSSADGVAQMEARLAGRTHAYLLILFGTIDAGQAVNPQVVCSNVAAIASYARSLGMVAVVGTIPPRLDETANARVQQINALLRTLGDNSGTLVADHYTRLVQVAAGTLSRVVCEDGIHPSDLGYSVMAEVWYRTLTGSSVYPLGDITTRPVRRAVAQNER